ncbi:recombinase family protein [Candidatus Kaiserbacteria bacterium]|nr:recombinase family protein [Candidatus Kaiserbacteria bacterium]
MSRTEAPEGFVPKTVLAPVATRYCLYARKSTESEEQQVLSIDSQIKEMLQMAERDNLEIVEIKKESHSAKEAGMRPVFNEIVEEIKLGKFNGILTWAPDRISRNAGDLGRIVDLMDSGVLQEIRTYGQKFSNNPNEKFLLMILGSQAKLENDNKVVNVKRGMRARCEMGLYPCIAPTGYMNSKHTDKRCHIEIDPERAPIVKKMFEKIAYENITGRQLYFWLRDEVKFKTRTGKFLYLGNLYMVLRNHFYYGTFEYPKGSGEWYKGAHEPLISKALFDQVQEKIKVQNTRENGMQSKEFAFTKLITCGLCGSGITADEKYKKQKNGNVHRYVYYGCTKHNDKNCKCGYINEEDLIEQLTEMMDSIEFNEIGMRNKIKDEIERHKKFQAGLLNEKETKVKVKDIEIRNYAKYILREGQVHEKRELLSCLKTRLLLANKTISLGK